MTEPEPRDPQDDFTCPDCGYTAPRIGGLISLHHADCPNVSEDDPDYYGHDYDGDQGDDDYDGGEVES